jgi:spectinomycin phosphotransferase
VFGDAPLPDDAITAAVEGAWSLEVDALEYQPVGYGSYHWLATTAGGRRWFVTVDAASGPFAVRQAYAVAAGLADAGLEFVRGPLLAGDGQVAVNLGDWLISVWPWIEGRSATTGDHTSRTDLAMTMELVRRLHEFDGLEPVSELVEDWDLSGRAELVSLLSGRGWGERNLRRRGARTRGGGEGWYRAEVGTVRPASCSGADRRGSFRDHSRGAACGQRAARRPRPDVDRLGHRPMGARERDLWSIVGIPGWQDGYGDWAPCGDVVETYRLQWELSEVADFAQLLSLAEDRSLDADVAMRELRRYLSG